MTPTDDSQNGSSSSKALAARAAAATLPLFCKSFSSKVTKRESSTKSKPSAMRRRLDTERRATKDRGPKRATRQVMVPWVHLPAASSDSGAQETAPRVRVSPKSNKTLFQICERQMRIVAQHVTRVGDGVAEVISKLSANVSSSEYASPFAFISKGTGKWQYFKELHKKRRGYDHLGRTPAMDAEMRGVSHEKKM